MPLPAQQRALEQLRRFHFPELDLNSLDSDSEGALFYEDHFPGIPAQAPALSESVIAQAAVPVSPFPSNLYLHSNPGAAAVLYLNFSGETVTDTVWNNSVGRSEISAVAFSIDSDYSTFNDAEQTAIRCIWQRVTEDFAPFQIDVTTERPATFGSRTAHALITRSTDFSNNTNPSSTAGGVAYVNVFGSATYASFRPAWIYANNLGSESTIAEAVSHEIGHNLGLSHDGQTDGTEYYSGHGSGTTSWGPIMGVGYNRNVTQWSKGEYYLANNSQDDLAVIAAKIPFRSDDAIDLPDNARPLVVTGITNITCTTLENDPANTDANNKGALQYTTDSDVFTFATGDGPIRLQINPWITSSGTRGGNLDILAELRDQSGTLLLINNSATESGAQIQTTLRQGTYYLYIRNSGAGNPLSASPTGYTAYGSIGQYFISGYVAPQVAAAEPVYLTATVNNPAWGSITPASGAYSAGTEVQLLATPSPWYRFLSWTDGTSATTNPLRLVMTTNLTVVANFVEMMTSIHPTPYWWLAAQGYTDDMETAVETVGQNGLPLWQSYVAGLNPNDPNSQLRLSLTRSANGANRLNWNPVNGRVYTIWASTNLSSSFTPFPGASDLPATVSSFTTTVSPAPITAFYRLEVRKPD